MTPNIQLNPSEKILLETSPSQRYAFYLIIAKFWTWIVSAIILYMMLNMQGVVNLLSSFHFDNISKVKSGVLLVLCLFMVISYLWFSFINNRYRYYFTNERCIYYYSFFATDNKMLPYSRIFNAEIKQNFLQILFNIASISINTQNISDPNFMTSNFPVLKGLPKNTAEQISQIVSSNIPRV
jgi:uncharacterized membrane protein YdbT with pleckstrin-like domain